MWPCAAPLHAPEPHKSASPGAWIFAFRLPRQQLFAAALLRASRTTRLEVPRALPRRQNTAQRGSNGALRCARRGGVCVRVPLLRVARRAARCYASTHEAPTDVDVTVASDTERHQAAGSSLVWTDLDGEYHRAVVRCRCLGHVRVRADMGSRVAENVKAAVGGIYGIQPALFFLVFLVGV